MIRSAGCCLHFLISAIFTYFMRNHFSRHCLHSARVARNRDKQCSRRRRRSGRTSCESWLGWHAIDHLNRAHYLKTLITVTEFWKRGKTNGKSIIAWLSIRLAWDFTDDIVFGAECGNIKDVSLILKWALGSGWNGYGCGCGWMEETNQRGKKKKKRKMWWIFSSWRAAYTIVRFRSIVNDLTWFVCVCARISYLEWNKTSIPVIESEQCQIESIV